MQNIWLDNLDFTPVGRRPDMTAATLGLIPLLKDTLSKKTGHLTECQKSGTILLKDLPEILSKIDALQGRLVYEYHDPVASNKIWLWDDSILDIDLAGTYANFSIFTQNRDFADKVAELVHPYFQTAVKQGHIYAIVSNNNYLSLSSIGNAGIPLIEKNYMPSVMADYKYAIKDLNSSSPSGRIVILEGTAGTGKSHMVRAMLLDVPDALFILVPPDMVPSLAGPQFLPLLINNRHVASGPIVLVLEDADKCLVVREDNNMNSIQALLNLGDGILGSLLDLRIIATTNAKKLEMEPAVLRPGRLSKRLEVGALDYRAACGVFKGLLPNASLPDKLAKGDNPHAPLQMSLAEVYALARQAGWFAPSATKSDDHAYDDDGLDNIFEDD